MWQGISCFSVISVFYRVTYYVYGAQAIFDPDRSHYNSIIWVTAKLQKSNYIHMNWLQFIHEKYPRPCPNLYLDVGYGNNITQLALRVLWDERCAGDKLT